MRAISDAGPVSRILYGVAAVVIIPLGRTLLSGSSDLPEGSSAPSRHIPSYLVLLRVGFAVPRTLLRGRCALTAPFHPYLSHCSEAVCFLLHFPSRAPTPHPGRYPAHCSLEFGLSSLFFQRERSPGPTSTVNIIDVWAQPVIQFCRRPMSGGRSRLQTKVLRQRADFLLK